MAESVFGEDLDGKDLNRNTLRSVRLVQKRWLQTATKLLRQSKEPLYQIILNKDNSVNGTAFVQSEGKILDQFKNHLLRPSTTDIRIPTFSLEISEEAFRQENHDSITDCLTSWGESLVKMELFVPANGGSLICIFPALDLPFLEKLTIHLSTNRLQNLNEGEYMAEHSYNITSLINSLLIGAFNLRRLYLPFYPQSTNSLPYGIKFVALPQTLTHLDIKWNMRGAGMNMLIRNNFPNLTSLNILITNDKIADGILLSVLKKVCQTLKHLHMTSIFYEGPPRNISFISFPIMKNLTELSLPSIQCELDNNITSLENCLPKLETLIFRNQTFTSFRKLTEKSRFTSVKKLFLKLVNENVHQFANEKNFVRSLDLESIKNVHVSFPNLRLLALRFNPTIVCGLKYVFMEMRQLDSLILYVAGGSALELNPDFWDSLLIGAPIDFIASLRAAPNEFQENVHLGLSDIPSIKMLTELRFLELGTHPLTRSNPNFQESLMSDLVFHFAFLLMPKLRELKLHDRFRASEYMTKKWEDGGRTFGDGPYANF